MDKLHRFIRLDFENFKAFKNFTLPLKRFNILVGPNNAGKSTILSAFRILATGMRRALSRKPEQVTGPSGHALGYDVDIRSAPFSEENIFHNYDDSRPASVKFALSNGNELLLYFLSKGKCCLIPRTTPAVLSPARFRTSFNCPIGFVPVLGPVDQKEELFDREAARIALFNARAARNFRNIWHHYPDKFVEFRETLQRTWPGMDIQKPEVDFSHAKPRLHMFCPEDRIPREIFWSGFGFQVWCQMLTHLLQSRDSSIFLIDEPDIYLHSNLQRQLLDLLRALGPDIVLATHSTEIITEADIDDIVLVSKTRQRARRIKNPAELLTSAQ